MHRAIIKLVGLAKRNRVPLRQSYLRLGAHFGDRERRFHTMVSARFI